jgi:hypothetical protein
MWPPVSLVAMEIEPPQFRWTLVSEPSAMS